MTLPSTIPPILFLDLDDTVLRFSCGQPDAWKHALRQHTDPVDLEGHLDAVRRVGHIYWQNAKRAHWGRQNLQEARCLIAREALGPRGVDSELATAVGRSMTQAKEDAVRPFEGAIETLTALQNHGHRLALLTNGCSAFQRRKLERFDLARYFELILIEGELGFGKPDARVFQRALDHFGVAPQTTWMIGDNLSADIAGAQSVGIQGVWNNCNALSAPDGTKPAHEIDTLSALLRALEPDAEATT